MEKIPENIRKMLPFRELRPPQKEAVDKGLFEGRNMVVASPTASGKTLVAEMAGIHNILSGRGKMLYVVPLRSIAQEKYDHFKETYPEFRTGLSLGDLDSSDKWLDRCDIIIATSEKMDSLLRHRAPWVSSIATVVIDEVHLINDVSRGPTLEILMTKLSSLKAQFICLSATIQNSNEIAEWIGAELVRSDYRPVQLKEGVFHGDSIEFREGEEDLANKGRPEKTILSDTLRKGKQAIFFVSSRRYAEGLARILSELGLEGDRNLASLVRKSLRVPTTQCKKLSSFVEMGVAFHHAGLVSKQRKLVEQGFRQGKIKAICATPTLAMGVNLPAYRVVVRDLTRFVGELVEIPVLEYKQMAGRAGRPGYDEIGEAICIAKSGEEKERIFEKYINGSPEEIYSKLSSEPVLRSHVLALVCTGSRDIGALKKFFSRTFWAMQFGDMAELGSKVEKTVDRLFDWGMVEKRQGKLLPTPLGNRVSELYLDPRSARHMADCMIGKNPSEDFAYLHMACKTAEMKPLIRVKPQDFAEIQMMLGDFPLLEEEPGPWDFDYEDFLSAFKTSLVMYEWINERTEDEIMERHRVSPGGLYYRVRNLDWLLYGASEIAKLVEAKQHVSELMKLRVRVKKGVKEDILPLVKYRGIGRFRARKLFRNGIRNSREIRENREKVKKILGTKVGESLLEQV